MDYFGRLLSCLLRKPARLRKGRKTFPNDIAVTATAVPSSSPRTLLKRVKITLRQNHDKRFIISRISEKYPKLIPPSWRLGVFEGRRGNFWIDVTSLNEFEMRRERK